MEGLIPSSRLLTKLCQTGLFVGTGGDWSCFSHYKELSAFYLHLLEASPGCVFYFGYPRVAFRISVPQPAIELGALGSEAGSQPLTVWKFP